jgi:hypothetical protein
MLLVDAVKDVFYRLSAFKVFSKTFVEPKH